MLTHRKRVVLNCSKGFLLRRIKAAPGNSVNLLTICTCTPINVGNTKDELTGVGVMGASKNNWAVGASLPILLMRFQ